MSRRAMSRRTLLTISLAAGLPALAACSQREDPGLRIGSPTSSQPPATVRVGVVPVIEVAPVYLGKQKGYFEARGINLEPVSKPTGEDIIAGVLSGDLDIGFSNVISLLVAREKGSPVIAVEGASSTAGVKGYESNGVLVPKDSPVRGNRQLVGRKVAVNALDNIGDTAVRVAVKAAGGDPFGVNFVVMPFTAMPAALASGEVDAIWCTEPFVTVVRAAGGRLLPNDTFKVFPKLQSALYFTTQQQIEENRSVMSRFKAALGDSLLYARDHQVEVREILGTYTEIPRDLAVSAVLPDWPVGRDLESATAVGAAARAFGTLQKAPDVQGLMGFEV